MAEIIASDNQDLPKPPVPEGYEVQEKTTKNGKTYQIGTPIKSQAAGSDGGMEVRAMGANLHIGGPEQQFNPPWETGKDWQNTSDEVQRNTGIDRYKIENGGFFFQHRLWIHTNRQAHYNFHCGEPDNYELWTIMDHDHYIDYNSTDPRMMSVEYQ